jgi:hypothetical protein
VVDCEGLACVRRLISNHTVMREKQRTEAATFDIHIDANVDINIFARITACGLDPAFASMNAASLFATD